MKKSKGILPDGKKIKELRKQAGKSQKGMIQGSPIELRTYQRAEQGLPVLPEILQRIGVLFSKDPSELRLSKQPAKQSEHSFRLYCASHHGANKLVTELQRWTTNVEFRFEISPGTEVAERVATTVEFCQALEITEDAQARMSPAQKIRAIGQLNDLLGTLASDGVHTYAGEYYTYDDEVEQIEIDPETSETRTIKSPGITSHLRIVFAGQQHDFILNTYSTYRTWEAAAQRATRWNLKHGIEPKWVDAAHPFDDRYAIFYRKAYAQIEAEKAPLLISAVNEVGE